MDLNKILQDAEESAKAPKYSLRSVDTIEEEVRASLLRLLERGAKSSGALRKSLLEKEHPAEIVEQLLLRFSEVGLIDDYSLAKDLAQTLSTRKGKSKSMIAIELREKGLPQDAIAQALTEIDVESELETAKSLAVNKMQRMVGLDAQIRERRVAGFLSRKGYTSSVVWAAVRFATESLSQ